MWIESFLLFLERYEVLVAFLAGFLSGETIIIPLGFLSAQGYFSLWKLLVFCTLGMYLSEFIPFGIGKIKFLRKYFKRRSFPEKLRSIEKKMHYHARGRPITTLFATKFIKGIGMPTLFYFGYKNILSVKKFAMYILFLDVIYVPGIILIGWFGGKGFWIAINVLKNVKIAVLVIIVLAIVLFYAQRWIRKRITEMQKRKS